MVISSTSPAKDYTIAFTVEECPRSVQLMGEIHEMVVIMAGITSRASDSGRWRGAIASSWVHAFTLRWLSTPAVCTGPDNAGTKGAKEREVRDHSSHCTAPERIHTEPRIAAPASPAA